jgi:hypothetical protein
MPLVVVLEDQADVRQTLCEYLHSMGCLTMDTDCGATQFEKRAVYWLAAQYCDKAGAVDSSIKGLANKTAASYRAAAPSTSEIFSEGKQGQRIAFNCWIGESIVVPNIGK